MGCALVGLHEDGYSVEGTELGELLGLSDGVCEGANEEGCAGALDGCAVVDTVTFRIR